MNNKCLIFDIYILTLNIDIQSLYIYIYIHIHIYVYIYNILPKRTIEQLMYMSISISIYLSICP